MIHILEDCSIHQEKSRTYITALFYFIHYISRTPEDMTTTLNEELLTMIGKEGNQHMDAENQELSPTLAGMAELAQKKIIEQSKEGWKREGLEEGRKEGEKIATIRITLSLIKCGFTDEKIEELTDMSQGEIETLRYSLQV